MSGTLVAIPLLLCSLIAIITVLYPDLSLYAAHFFGVGRGTDLLLYLSFIIAIFLMILIHIKFKQQSILITKLARSIALLNAK